MKYNCYKKLPNYSEFSGVKTYYSFESPPKKRAQHSPGKETLKKYSFSYENTAPGHIV